MAKYFSVIYTVIKTIKNYSILSMNVIEVLSILFGLNKPELVPIPVADKEQRD